MTVRRLDPWLMAAVGVAVVVRIWGLRFGLPHTLARPDEETIAAIAMLFFSRHLNPHFFRYPSLMPYTVAILYVGFLNVGRLAGWFTSELRFGRYAASWPLPFWVLQRSLVAVLGAASVVLVYAIARRIAGVATARIAAFFLALAYLHVRDSHFGVTDVPMTFLVLSSVALALRYADGGRTRDIVISGALAGLAASTKYNGVLALVPVLAAVEMGHERGAAREGLAAPREEPGLGKDRDARGHDDAGVATSGARGVKRSALAAACILAAFVAFVAGTPFSIIDARAFWTDFAAESEHLRLGHIPGMPSGWQYHATTSLRYGMTLPLLGAGVVGWVLLAIWRRAGALIILSFPVVYYVAIGYGRTAFVRYMIPLVPFLCVGAAFLVTSAIDWMIRAGLPRRARSLALVTTSALLVSVSAFQVVRTNILLSRTDTRLLAAESIARRWPDGVTMFQAGSIYAQVQFWPRPWGNRYVQYKFDSLAERFATDDRVQDPPDVIVVLSSPLSTYDLLPNELRPILAEQYVAVEHIDGIGSDATGRVYDFQDAFYLPLAGFDGLERPGPTIDIYVRRDLLR